MRDNFFLAILYLIAMQGCVPGTKSSDIEVQPQIVLHYSEEKNNINISEITADRFCLIPETTDASLISYPRRIFELDNLICIVDSRYQLCAFEKNGKHKFTIHNIGAGPGEYSSLRDAAPDENNNRILLLADNKIIWYDTEGIFTGKEVVLEDYADAMVLNGNVEYLLSSPYPGCDPDQNQVMTIDLITNEVWGYMRHLTDYAPSCSFGGPMLNMKKNGKVLMTRKFDSNIYSLLFDNYSAAYNLDWGENLFKPVDGKQYDCKDLMIETLDTRQVYAVFNVQDGDSIMSFSTNVPGLYYADKASEKVYRVVTVIDNEFNIPVFKMYPVTNSDGWIVFSMDYHNLEQFSSSQNFGNEKFREIFDSMSEDSNPLLLFYKLK